MQTIANTLVHAGTLALFSIGLGLLYISGRFFNFAHAVPFLIAPYLAWTLTFSFGLRLPLAIACSLISVGLLGIALESGLYQALRERGATSLGLMLASFGVLIVAQNLVALFWNDQTKLLSTGDMSQGLLFGSARLTPIQIVSCLAGPFFVVAVSLAARFTPMGAQFRAVSDDSHLAEIVGIRVVFIRTLVAAIAALIAGVAGILVGYDAGLRPDIGMQFLFPAVVVIIVGGVSSVWSALAGGIIVASVHQISISFLGGRWYEVILFGMLILFLLIRPQGVLSSRDKSESRVNL